MNLPISVLLVVIGFAIGVAIVVVANNFKESNAKIKADSIIENAKKNQKKLKETLCLKQKKKLTN